VTDKKTNLTKHDWTE